MFPAPITPGLAAWRERCRDDRDTAAAFFTTALAHLGAGAARTLMVGDDIETDVLAAQRQGLTGVLVKTGKYLPSAHRHASGTPDHMLESFADLPALLEDLS